MSNQASEVFPLPKIVTNQREDPQQINAMAVPQTFENQPGQIDDNSLVPKVTLLEQPDRPENSYFYNQPPEVLKDLDRQLVELRLRSFQTNFEEVRLSPEDEFQNLSNLETGAFVTNHVVPEIAEALGYTDETEKQSCLDVFEKKGGKRYWGSNDVRQCVFVVLTTPSGEIKAAMHVPTGEAENLRDFQAAINILFLPFGPDQQAVDCSLVGAFEDADSVESLAAIIHSIETRFPDTRYQTVDVLNRNSGARRPLYDTETKKMASLVI